MAQTTSKPRVVPAQVNFLTIFNPSFGDSDETVRNQILCYISKEGRKRKSNKSAKHSASSQAQSEHDTEIEENDKLRQVGLAQGIVNFAKNFSGGVNVDSVETEKSRIILHELEPGWWVLTSIDLTQLPSARRLDDTSSTSSIEYSNREVSPPQLLVAQLVQAHSTFLLHHAAKLDDLYDRVGRQNLSGLLERFWTRFVDTWDVLLHGNPAVDIYNCTKLAGGGELGVGVGEEEWGSGEREVLEGFVDRTEGLIDLIVGRYGPGPVQNQGSSGTTSDLVTDNTPWLGAGEDSGAADGILFSGVSMISKKSLATVSQWMEAIFKYGDKAYGVGENPGSRPRQRRARPRTQRVGSNESSTSQSTATDGAAEMHPGARTPKSRAPDLRRKAMENSATPPGIPAPLVSQVERSLNEALTKVGERSTSPSPKQEKSLDEAMKPNQNETQSSTFGAENMKKIFTLGYGSSWTLNPNGLPGNKSEDNRTDKKTPAVSRQESSIKVPVISTASDQGMQEIDPTPEVSDDESSRFQQRLEQSIGKFLIGLSGDLENTEFDSDNDTGVDEASQKPQKTQRMYLRTLMIELANPNYRRKEQYGRRNSYRSLQSNQSDGTVREEPKTSAAASVDGVQPNLSHEKVQIAVYIHQPFIFVFLFELHTPTLTIPAFYRSIHHQLGPLQRPLLRSTDPARIADRIAEATKEKSSTQLEKSQEASTIYDLIYNPSRRTIRTSIPNIPVPGSLAAEGLSSRASSLTVSGSWYTLGIPVGSTGSLSPRTDVEKLVHSGWNRVEALNVYTQILNTWIASRNANELERTVKTGRQWWVLWMKVPSKKEWESYQEAFLVRKSADSRSTSNHTKSPSRGPGRWLLREQPRDVSGSSNGSAGSVSARGVSEGVGVDARKWVDALMHLTQ